MTLRTALYELWARNKAMNLDCRGWGVKGCIKQLESMGLDTMPVYYRSMTKSNEGLNESFAYIQLGNDGQEFNPKWIPEQDWCYSANDLWKAVKKYISEGEFQNISVTYGHRSGDHDQDRYEIVAKGKRFNGYTEKWEEGRTWEGWEEEWQ